jgi:hypothetical protein
MPRIVKPPLPFSPHACLVTGTIDGEFIDFERDFIGMDPRIVLRKEVVEEAARECCNMVPLHEVEEMRRQVGELGQKLDAALSDLNLTKDFEAQFGQSLEAGVTAGINIETASPAGEEGSI